MRNLPILAGAFVFLFCGCLEDRGVSGFAPSPTRTPDPSPWRPERLDDERLPNTFRLHNGVLSGGQPDRKTFEALREIGVKTVLSVDAARPDVELAREHGMRYVHLPHGYDGIPEERQQQLARAVREFEGPVYIHCHHGKHRSPAAAAVACVSAGLLAPENALPVLRAAGTSEAYLGLIQAAVSARPLDAEYLNRLPIELPEIAEIPPLTEAMVQVERSLDHLQAVAAAGWSSPPDHPDIDPAHEALLLREQYAELLRTDELDRQPAEFRALLEKGEKAAAELETLLAQPVESSVPLIRRREAALKAVTQNCTACHRKFRDLPPEGHARISRTMWP